MTSNGLSLLAGTSPVFCSDIICNGSSPPLINIVFFRLFFSRGRKKFPQIYKKMFRFPLEPRWDLIVK